MKYTLLELEQKCNLLLERQGDEIVFFCDGFDTLKALFLLPEVREINLTDLFFEMGAGVTYKCWERKDFEKLDSFSDLLDMVKTLPSEFYIFNLKFISETLLLNIYDNRFFTVSSSTLGISGMTALINKLIKNIFLFTEEVCLQLIKILVENNNKYILINSKGEILAVYENYDDFLHR